MLHTHGYVKCCVQMGMWNTECIPTPSPSFIFNFKRLTCTRFWSVVVTCCVRSWGLMVMLMLPCCWSCCKREASICTVWDKMLPPGPVSRPASCNPWGRLPVNCSWSPSTRFCRIWQQETWIILLCCQRPVTQSPRLFTITLNRKSYSLQIAIIQKKNVIPTVGILTVCVSTDFILMTAST